MSQAPSSKAAGKRRCETQSGDELAPPVTNNHRQAKKKPKDASTLGDLSDSDSDSRTHAGDTGSDSGVSAVAERAQQVVLEAGVTGAVAAAAKIPLRRAIHLAKYANQTPEDILGKLLLLHPLVLKQQLTRFLLEKLMDKWRSDVYKHFKKPEIIPPQLGTNGPYIHRFRCGT